MWRGGARWHLSHRQMLGSRATLWLLFAVFWNWNFQLVFRCSAVSCFFWSVFPFICECKHLLHQVLLGVETWKQRGGAEWFACVDIRKNIFSLSFFYTSIIKYNSMINYKFCGGGVWGLLAGWGRKSPSSWEVQSLSVQTLLYSHLQCEWGKKEFSCRELHSSH